MSYNQLSNDELAEAAAERFSLEPELALRAIESKDKDLGKILGVTLIVDVSAYTSKKCIL